MKLNQVQLCQIKTQLATKKRAGISRRLCVEEINYIATSPDGDLVQVLESTIDGLTFKQRDKLKVKAVTVQNCGIGWFADRANIAVCVLTQAQSQAVSKAWRSMVGEEIFK